MLGADRGASPAILDSSGTQPQAEFAGTPAWCLPAREILRARIEALRGEIGHAQERAFLQLLARADLEGERLRDALSTRLMEAFRVSASRGAFGLLYEVNAHHLLLQVAASLRRFSSRADPRDVLQEVFFNVYRYPHRFSAEREDAFRVWSAMIVRNTVLKHLRSEGRGGARAGRVQIPFEDLSQQAEPRPLNPVGRVIDGEDEREFARLYVNYLHLYLRFYSMLSERERTAIHLVEVEEASYKDAACQLGIKLENLKMVIFRARRKIHRAMCQVFEGQAPECRPARLPAARVAGAGGSESRPRAVTSPEGAPRIPPGAPLEGQA
jgi:RNA polymerase sigma factor (sigma-70 family)